MTACSRCGVSAWHPEARLCLATDCKLRAPQHLHLARTHPPSAACGTTGGGSSLPAAGDVVDQRASDCEANGARRQVQGVTVHTREVVDAAA